MKKEVNKISVLAKKKKFLIKIAPLAFQLTAAFSISLISALILIPIAAAERNTSGIGGEWIAILFIFYFSWEGAELIWKGER